MKIVSLLIILILNVSFIFAQGKKPSLKITGTVKEIALQEMAPNTKDAFYITYITLNLKLKNTGSAPVIFLQSKPMIEYAEVIQNEQGNDTSLARTDPASSSEMMTRNDWKQLKTTLDKQNPPPEMTQNIRPDEIIDFEGVVRLNIPKSQDYWLGKTDFNKTLPLDFIQKHSPVQIKIKCNTWDTLTLAEGSTDKKKAEFADKLQTKWINFGYLWIKDIEAETISIDFNSVIFKTLIN